MNSKILYKVNFIQKSWKLFNNSIIYNRVGFKCICITVSRQNTQISLKLFARATESGRPTGGCTFGKILPINVPKGYRWGHSCFMIIKFQSRQNNATWNPVFTLPLWILLKPWTLSFKTDTITGKVVTVKVTGRTQKVDNYFAKEEFGQAMSSTELRNICGSNVGNEFGVMLREKDLTNQNFSHDINSSDWVKYRWRHKGSIAALLSPYFTAESWGYYNQWKVQDLKDL